MRIDKKQPYVERCRRYDDNDYAQDAPKESRPNKDDDNEKSKYTPKNEKLR